MRVRLAAFRHLLDGDAYSYINNGKALAHNCWQSEAVAIIGYCGRQSPTVLRETLTRLENQELPKKDVHVLAISFAASTTSALFIITNSRLLAD